MSGVQEGSSIVFLSKSWFALILSSNICHSSVPRRITNSNTYIHIYITTTQHRSSWSSIQISKVIQLEVLTVNASTCWSGVSICTLQPSFETFQTKCFYFGSYLVWFFCLNMISDISELREISWISFFLLRRMRIQASIILYFWLSQFLSDIGWNSNLFCSHLPIELLFLIWNKLSLCVLAPCTTQLFGSKLLQGLCFIYLSL